MPAGPDRYERALPVTGLTLPNGPHGTVPRARRCRSSAWGRAFEAARYVPLEQLCLSPQCGFSSTVEGNALTEDQERAELALVVETAAEVWGPG